MSHLFTTLVIVMVSAIKALQRSLYTQKLFLLQRVYIRAGTCMHALDAGWGGCAGWTRNLSLLLCLNFICSFLALANYQSGSLLKSIDCLPALWQCNHSQVWMLVKFKFCRVVLSVCLGILFT